MSFPMSLRRTATLTVTCKPPKGSQKRKMAVFGQKVHFSRRTSATKFLYVKTVTDKVVRHSLTYLIVHKWVVGDCPLNVSCVTIMNHPLARQ